MDNKKIIRLLSEPRLLVNYFNNRGFLQWIPDETFLKWNYKKEMGYELDLNNPKTYNEKLQWLKLYDHNPKYTTLVDKYEVRHYIKKTIGEEYLIKNLGIWDSVDEINIEQMPNQFVLKTTHASGDVIICKDKSIFDLNSAKRKLRKTMNRNYYYPGREWPYKNVKPRIIAEEYMIDDSGIGLNDYKFFCFNGEPKLMFVATDRSKGEVKFDFYDLYFNHLHVKQHHENAKESIVKPDGFEDMIDLAKRLSKDIPHVRVDFYYINNRVYFGEMTFYHFSGYQKFNPESYDTLLGSYITLPNSMN